jgi:hypothetical protein
VARQRPRGSRGQLVEVCVERVGVRGGTKVAFRLLQWAYVAGKAGRWPSVPVYMEWTGVSERTAWLHRSTIREAFTEAEFRSIVAQLLAGGADELPKSKAVQVRINLASAVT